jgi:hypothetical protein
MSGRPRASSHDDELESMTGAIATLTVPTPHIMMTRSLMCREQHTGTSAAHVISAKVLPAGQHGMQRAWCFVMFTIPSSAVVAPGHKAGPLPIDGPPLALDDGHPEWGGALRLEYDSHEPIVIPRCAWSDLTGKGAAGVSELGRLWTAVTGRRAPLGPGPDSTDFKGLFIKYPPPPTGPPAGTQLALTLSTWTGVVLRNDDIIAAEIRDDGRGGNLVCIHNRITLADHEEMRALPPSVPSTTPQTAAEVKFPFGSGIVEHVLPPGGAMFRAWSALGLCDCGYAFVQDGEDGDLWDPPQVEFIDARDGPAWNPMTYIGAGVWCFLPPPGMVFVPVSDGGARLAIHAPARSGGSAVIVQRDLPDRIRDLGFPRSNRKWFWPERPVTVQYEDEADPEFGVLQWAPSDAPLDLTFDGKYDRETLHISRALTRCVQRGVFGADREGTCYLAWDTCAR